MVSLELESLKGPKNNFPWNLYLKGRVKKDLNLCNFKKEGILEEYILKKAEKILK